VEAEPGGGNEPLKRLPTWVTQSALDPGNYGLSGPGTFGKFSLGQSRPCPSLAEKTCSILSHDRMIADSLSPDKFHNPMPDSPAPVARKLEPKFDFDFPTERIPI
jgi:hypothetical protein